MVGPSEVMSSLGFAGDDWDLVFFGDGLATVLLFLVSGVHVGVAPCADPGALFCVTGAARAI